MWHSPFLLYFTRKGKWLNMDVNRSKACDLLKCIWSVCFPTSYVGIYPWQPTNMGLLSTPDMGILLCKICQRSTCSIRHFSAESLWKCNIFYSTDILLTLEFYCLATTMGWLKSTFAVIIASVTFECYTHLRISLFQYRFRCRGIHVSMVLKIK